MFSKVLQRSSFNVLRNVVRYSSEEVGSTEYFNSLLEKNKVVVFMKGTPDKPRCGFSNAVVQIMRMHGVDYEAYDVLSDENVRQGIKDFSNWPTIPQIYINKEFVGGCDILLQMHQSGEFIEELRKQGITSALLEQEIKKDKDNEDK
uniref:Glutaredoxin-related protein 5, mitochondrial n=1 Tax=Hirondellea gigas TaxID=1518452 RepID=A0A2P2I3J4_9CRUS